MFDDGSPDVGWPGEDDYIEPGGNILQTVAFDEGQCQSGKSALFLSIHRVFGRIACLMCRGTHFNKDQQFTLSGNEIEFS